MSTTARAAKQVLITVNRPTLKRWEAFELYLKENKINRSQLIRDLTLDWFTQALKVDRPSMKCPLGNDPCEAIAWIEEENGTAMTARCPRHGRFTLEVV